MLCSRKRPMGRAMYRFHFPQSVLFFAAFSLLSACATPPEPEVAEAPPPEPELNLNLPDPSVQASCDCNALAAEENYFDRGVRALAARDYQQARRYFERHRQEGGDEVQREADVGIAFVTLMSEAVSTDSSTSIGVDERAEVMILALAAVQTLEGRIQALDALNRALSKDLEKREEALKRLRDLTLGQQESGR